MNLMGKLWDHIRLTFTSGMFLALQMWRFDVFPLPLFFLMTGWTEWHFILFLTSTKTLCKKETMAGCKPQSIFRADTAQTVWNVQLLWNKHFIFKWHICWFFFPLNLWCFFIFLSQSQRRHLGLYREAVLEDLVINKMWSELMIRNAK